MRTRGLQTVVFLSVWVACPQLAVADSAVISLENARGKKLYEKLCSQCHGKLGVPEPEVASLLKPAPSDLTAFDLKQVDGDEMLRKKIAAGSSNNKLHYEGSLSKKQVSLLAEYLKSLMRRKD